MPTTPPAIILADMDDEPLSPVESKNKDYDIRNKKEGALYIMAESRKNTKKVTENRKKETNSAENQKREMYKPGKQKKKATESRETLKFSMESRKRPPYNPPQKIIHWHKGGPRGLFQGVQITMVWVNADIFMIWADI